MTKKDKILQAALELFNEKGYGNVSLREIAKKAETTIGNLTYHFPQKEDLLISIVDELHTGFIPDLPDGVHRAELLSFLLNSFITAEKNEREKSFYYKNIYMISLDSEEITKHNNSFQKSLYQYYSAIFHRLKEDAVIDNNVNDSIVQSIVYTIITLSAVWMQENTPNNNPLLEPLRISTVLCNIIRPLIMEKYVEEFTLQCKEKGIDN